MSIPGREDSLKEMERLCQALNQYSHHYHVLDRPLVSDLEYDRLYDRLVQLETAWPDLVRIDSPSRRVGSDLSSEFPEYPHSIPVLSLDKAYTSQDIQTWVKRCASSLESQGLQAGFATSLEEKLDGLSVVLYYENGVLVRALTRGNGLVGNEVTDNIRTIHEVPLRLPRPVSGAFRGEVFLGTSDFREINRTLEIPYANPRNLAGGTLRRVKSSEVARVPLRLYIYEGFYDQAPDSHQAILKDMEALGFPVNPHVRFFTLPGETGNLMDAVSEFTGRRSDLGYEIDGLVLKLDEIKLRNILGYTEHHPRWALAYKFENPQGTSTVRQIDVQVGRTGRVTPVARLDPVLVGGATIQNVTLHNQDYINALELGIGDVVTVSRRGDVIPAVESVVEKISDHIWSMPSACPSCGSALSMEGAHLFCHEFDCPDRQLGRLVFFAGRDQMDIDGLGLETVQTLRAQGLLKDIPDIYSFDPDRLVGLPGWGEKKASRLREGIEASKKKPFATVLSSLGLPEIGPRLVRLILDSGSRTLDDLFSLADQGNPEVLMGIHGIGEKTALVFMEEFSSPRVRALLEALRASGLCMEDDRSAPAIVEGPFSGQVWCVTGTFRNFKPRSLALQEVISRGGEASEDFSARVTHLLAGENAGSKLEKARKKGIGVYSEEDFLRMLGPSVN